MEDKLDDDFIREIELKNAGLRINRSVKKWALFCAAAMLVNVLVFMLFSRLYMDAPPQRIGFAIGQYVVGASILGFLLGLLIALLPYKGLKYKFKYLRAALIGTFAVECVLVVSQFQYF